ncbi:dTDP-4-dehydrorhamnose reductase [Aquimarina sp. MMG016]|uniref:dTDP-4-dehydrorhamnose reductase n=1 Tax=Aquimarina sp. MMG016 TaxID=2822690 RepID=UPI001B3A5276|nr:dTDP-4-dehydrorhamnose reductase [Aquimarina sp. MMG016]MBQ4820072.1 dTDP-4-dehydrorhamnose reductase [Aquimarina sp. MMG016]
MKILITGSNGQLGQCIKRIESEYASLSFFFTDSKELDITEKDSLEHHFRKESFDYVINCAAYTNVEQSEKEPEKASLVNANGVKNLTQVCKENNTILIHISTDYVFDGKKSSPYVEEDLPNPINKYGESKLLGEKYIQEILEKYFIIRTSWLYSQYGKNFYKTILERSNTQTNFTITTSETGTPTNANDLARFLLQIVETKSENYGIYHFSNLGNVTWYDFAKEILKISGKLEGIKLEKTDNYPTFAKRPKHSVLSKEKVEKNFDLKILNWKESLEKIMKN